jgi:predicted lipid-binding transport protein (Tim44 family)
VPLSEHERRQLEQIEQALRAGDPRFADAVRAADPRVHYQRRVIEAALGFVIGVGLLLAGVVVNVILIAVAGFVVMLACSLWAVTSYRRMTGVTTGHVTAKDGGSGQKRPAAKGRPTGKQARGSGSASTWMHSAGTGPASHRTWISGSREVPQCRSGRSQS